MTQYTRRAIVVVTADVATIANTQTKKLDTLGGERTFTVGLSASGVAPATHYWCSWQLTPAQYTQLGTLLTTITGQAKAWLFDGATTTPEQVLTIMGLNRVTQALP